MIHHAPRGGNRRRGPPCPATILDEPTSVPPPGRREVLPSRAPRGDRDGPTTGAAVCRSR